MTFNRLNLGLVSLNTLIRVESERRYKVGGHTRHLTKTRYYVAAFVGSVAEIAQRVRGY